MPYSPVPPPGMVPDWTDQLTFRPGDLDDRD